MKTAADPKILLSRQDFDDNAKCYKLCCCHIRNWAVTVCVMEIVCMVLNVTITLLNDFITTDRLGAIINVAVTVTFAVCVGLMLYGVLDGRALLLVPHMVMQVLSSQEAMLIR